MSAAQDVDPGSRFRSLRGRAATPAPVAHAPEPARGGARVVGGRALSRAGGARAFRTGRRQGWWRNADGVHLSVPHMGERTRSATSARRSRRTGSRPSGRNLDAFERAFAARIGRPAVALASGTAAIHLGLRLLGVGPGDEVLVSDAHLRREREPDPLPRRDAGLRRQRSGHLEDGARRSSRRRSSDRARRGRAAQGGRRRPPLRPVRRPGPDPRRRARVTACRVLEDAAEALGATYRGRPAGSLGDVGAFSFNGNKIITTTGGGMLVAQRPDVGRARRASGRRRRASPAPRTTTRSSATTTASRTCSPASAAGSSRCSTSASRQRRAVAFRYRDAFADLPGLDAHAAGAVRARTRTGSPASSSTRSAFGATRDDVLRALARGDIEARPLWKPMHLQPLYAGCERYGGDVAADLFERGLCLPSSSSPGASEQDRHRDRRGGPRLSPAMRGHRHRRPSRAPREASAGNLGGAAAAGNEPLT